MADILSGEIKARIEQYLADLRHETICSDPDALAKIRNDFQRKADLLRHKLGDVYADLETFHDMLFDPGFQIGPAEKKKLVAVMVYFLNPFGYFPGGTSLVGLVDDRLVIACAAQACHRALERFAREKEKRGA